MAFTTINKPTDHFNTITWTADETSPRSLTGFGFKPDFLWGGHEGSASLNPNITDSTRGGSKNLTSATDAGDDDGSHGIVDSFDTDGITVSNGTNATYPRLYWNETDPFGAGGSSYVYSYWKANGGTTSSNTDGTITSTAQANTTAGFSILTYTGNGTSGATIGHGLGKIPRMIIVKNRADDNWAVYHGSLGATKYIKLNTSDASITTSGTWNDTEPTSSVFSVANDNRVNVNLDTYVAYCFADIKGYSKFGHYEGNNSASGPFVYCGFKPQWVMIKRADGSGSWRVYDYKRDPINIRTKRRLIDASALSSTEALMDWTANGFKIRRGSDAAVNAAGEEYIYAAFAEFPFVSSSGTPMTAG